MRRFSRLATAVTGVAMLMATAVLLGASGERSEAGVPPFAASAIGTKVVDGVPLRVHVVVAVREGQDGRAVAEQAVRNLGAEPLSREDWVSLVDNDGSDNGVGGVWWESLNGDTTYAPLDTIVLEYSNLNEDLNGGKSEIQSAANSWNGISTSRLSFSWASNNNICPSLVLECGQGQPTDGRNTVGWVEMEAGILGVAWMIDDGQGGIPQETDVAFNTFYTWTTGGSPFAINLRTVALHELGHVAGLGHSDVRRATMFASYTKADISLHGDDIDGLVALYPSSGGPPPPEPEPEPSNPWCESHPPSHPAYEKKCGP